MQIKRLELQSKAPEHQESFYGQKLGLLTEWLGDKSLKVFAGSTTLIFNESSEYTPYHFAFNIPENQFSEAMTWINEKTDLFLHEGEPTVYFEKWDAHALYFSDADGNILEFIARHTLDNASKKKFGRDSILEVSEIGAPASDLSKMILHTISQTDLQIYSRFGDNFCAVGDAHGMFILVPENRNWMPTDIPSRPAPFAILFEGGSRAESFDKQLFFDGKKFHNLE